MAKMIFTERDEALAVLYMLLTRQMTRLADCFQHTFRLHKRGDSDGKLFRGYKAYAQSELADALWLIKRICDVLGVDFNETIELGVLRDKEKREEFLRRYPGEEWV